MTGRTYTLRSELRCICGGYFSESPLECSECGHVGCLDCDCECITPDADDYATGGFPYDGEEFGDYLVGDPDEIRLGRPIDDVDVGDLT